MREESIRQGEEYGRKIREEYDIFWNDPFWDYIRLKRVEFILKSLRRCRIDNAKALEIGCGIGFTTLALAGSDVIYSIDAIDMSKEAVKECMRLQQEVQHGKKCNFQAGDFYDFCPAHLNSYDLIYMHEVIEHMRNHQEVFEIALNSLKPGGILMVSTPNRERLDNKIRKFFGREPNKFDNLFHIKEFTFRELEDLGNKCRFKVIDKSGATLLGGLPLKLPKFIISSKFNYFLGQMFVPLSREILISYRKK
jgi:SAM-dependent methyltransferase